MTTKGLRCINLLSSAAPNELPNKDKTEAATDRVAADSTAKAAEDSMVRAAVQATVQAAEPTSPAIKTKKTA